MNKYLKQIHEILTKELQNYPVKGYIFGSRAHGRSSTGSDLDVGIDPMQELPAGLLSMVREELEESHVPYQVELIDLSRVSKDFAEKVRQEGILWIDMSKE